MEENNVSFFRVVKWYCIGTYVTMGGVGAKFYSDWEDYNKKIEGIQNIGKDLAAGELRKSWGKLTSMPRMRTDKECEANCEKLRWGFFLAPVSVPYFLIHGFPQF